VRHADLYAGGRRFTLVVQSEREGGRNDVRGLVDCISAYGEQEFADALDEALNPDRHGARPTLRYDLGIAQMWITIYALQHCSASHGGLPAPLQELLAFLTSPR
jgi:hypothetical protein